VSAVAAPPLLPTYARAPVTIVAGEGCWVVDAAGRRLLDFAAGIAVVSLGHRHPAPLAAAHAQLDRLWHASNLVSTEPQAALAERLSARFGGGAAFFCNSGAEAVEAALKLARKATGRPGAVALHGSFHGRTAGALALTGQPAKRTPFEPLVPGVRFVPPNDLDALAAAVGAETALVVLEPVLGEGGVIPLERSFVEGAAALAADAGALLCLDEVQTGVGRTGTFFTFEQLGVRPDLVTLAKGLANGLPIGCLLAADAHVAVLQPGDHGSTFGGNPVACAAACAVVDAVDEALLAHVSDEGARLLAGLSDLPAVCSVRGAGLLVGATLDRPAAPAVEACREAGLLVLSAGEDVLRLAPPLTVSGDEVGVALAILAEVLA
jgi:acetylornithine/N-succinyldiaminopimelate aminotransferase